jgi:hypothetical protein
MGREPESSPAHILGQKQTPERARKDRVSSQHQHQQKEQQRQRHHLPQHISAEGIEDSPLSLENSLKALAGAAISVGDLEVELNFLREKLSLGLVGGDEAVDDATSDAASVDTLVGYTAVLQMLWDYYNTAQRVAALFDQRWAELQSRGIALGLLSESLVRMRCALLWIPILLSNTYRINQSAMSCFCFYYTIPQHRLCAAVF